MHKRTSVFDNPAAEKEFLKHLEEKQKREIELFVAKEKLLLGDNCSEQIINIILESLC